MTEGDELFPAASPPTVADDADAVVASNADEPAGAEAASGSHHEARRAAVVPTCRSNVLEWLSSGLVTPKRAFDKYYEDALSARDDVVPVVRAPVGAGLLDVERARLGNFPVLVQLDATAVRWLAGDEHGYCAVMPLKNVVAFHFRDATDREEFVARAFDNIPVDRVPFVVSPEFFGDAPGPTIDALAHDLHAAEGARPEPDFRIADRLSGARTLGLHAAATSMQDLEWFADVAFSRHTEATSRKKRRTVEEWLAVTPALHRYAPANNAGVDERIFRAAAAVFLELNPSDAWNPTSILQTIYGILASDSSIRARERARWEAAVARARAVFAGDDAFTSFRVGEFRAEKALLLALIRNIPADVIAWRDEGVGAHPKELVLAAVLAGLASGRKALPADLRPIALDDALAVRELQDLRDDGAPLHADVRCERRGDDDLLVLKVEQQDVLLAQRPPPSAIELLAELDLSHEETARQLVSLAVEHGWVDAIETTVQFGATANITASKSSLRITSRGVPIVVSTLRPDDLRLAVAASLDPGVRSRIASLVAEVDT